MQKKGFVYIMSNQAMEGVLKVGFSLKDPAIRSAELDSTGLPFRWQVEYFVFVDDPYTVEQQVHSELNYCHVSKEFFKLEITSAIVEIRKVINLLNYTLYFEECDFEKRKEADEKTVNTTLPKKSLRPPVHKSSLNTFNKKNNIDQNIHRTNYTAPKRTTYNVIENCPNCQRKIRFKNADPPKGNQWICPICKTPIFRDFVDDDCFLLSPSHKLVRGVHQRYELGMPSGFVELEPKFIDILKLCSGENNVKHVVLEMISKHKNITSDAIKRFLTLALEKQWICKK